MEQQIDELGDFEVVDRNHRLIMTSDDEISLLYTCELEVPCRDAVDLTAS
jgi:hypothetical protein